MIFFEALRRRDFLKASAATVGAFLLEACGSSPAAPGKSDTTTTQPPPPTHAGVYANYHAGDDYMQVLGASVRRNGIAWQRDHTGTWVSVGPGVWRDNHYPAGSVYTGRQFITEPGAVNIAPNGCGFAKNGTSGWSLASDGAATLSVVDDAAAITAAGLQLLAGDTACLKLDNSAGGTAAEASVPLGTLSAEAHSFYVQVRGGAGSIFIRQAGVLGQTLFGASAQYTTVVSRNALAAPAAGTLCISADPGQVVLFLLPQVEASVCETSPVPNATNGTTERIGEFFTWSFTNAPGPMAIYMRRTWTPMYRFNPYLGIGAPEVSAGQFIHLGLDNGTHTRLTTTTAVSVSGDTTPPNIGDDCRIVGRFDALGNGTCEQSLNGRGSTFSPPATDNPGYDAAFAVQTAAIGRYTGVSMPIIGSHIVIATDISLSLDELEAL